MNVTIKEDFVTLDPETMHGTPVFKGTRVPIDTLFDYLATGDSLEEFLEDFPSVQRNQAEMAVAMQDRWQLKTITRIRLDERPDFS